jgi:hypothetical protein
MYFVMDELKCPELAIALKNAWVKEGVTNGISVRTQESNSMDVYAHAFTNDKVVTEVWPAHADSNGLAIFFLEKKTENK